MDSKGSGGSLLRECRKANPECLPPGRRWMRGVCCIPRRCRAGCPLRGSVRHRLKRPVQFDNQAAAEKHQLETDIPSGFAPARNCVARGFKHRRDFVREQRFRDPIELHVQPLSLNARCASMPLWAPAGRSKTQAFKEWCPAWSDAKGAITPCEEPT